MAPRSAKILAGVVAITTLAGCGADSIDPMAQAAVTPQTASRTTAVRVENSDYGQVLFDGKGGALYLFTADAQGEATCYGACAKAWPPFIARDRLRAGAGVDEELLGTTERRGGRRQVTYDGHPLYFYVHDEPHEIYCHDVYEFGGDWLVVQASGDPAP